MRKITLLLLLPVLLAACSSDEAGQEKMEIDGVDSVESYNQVDSMIIKTEEESFTEEMVIDLEGKKFRELGRSRCMLWVW